MAMDRRGRWGRLLLIVLLVLPMFAAIGLCADDGWTAVADPAESDENRSDSPRRAVRCAWVLPVPFSVWRTVRSDPALPSSPLDLPHPRRPRASSRLIVSRVSFPSFGPPLFTRGDARHEDHSADDRRPGIPVSPRWPTSARCCTSR